MASARRPFVVKGRYQVQSTLGVGTQGTVFLAYDLRDRRWVALKTASPDADDRDRWCFVREARLLAQLRHPHLLGVLDVVNFAGVPAIVTPLAVGGSVRGWMQRNGPLPARLAVEVAGQCASALTEIHAAGIVHRDVKPANILIRADDTVALADLGTALGPEELDRSEGAGSVVGTPSFMAPEQHDPDRRVDGAVDVYALGATLHRMCTGRREPDLFRCRDDVRVLLGLTPSLAAVVRRCCQFLPSRRPTMAELGVLLQDAHAYLPPPSPGTPPLCERPMDLPDASQPGAADEQTALLEARFGLDLLATEDRSTEPHDTPDDTEPVAWEASAEGASEPSGWSTAG